VRRKSRKVGSHTSRRARREQRGHDKSEPGQECAVPNAPLARI
jgi:hypothetical protein